MCSSWDPESGEIKHGQERAYTHLPIHVGGAWLSQAVARKARDAAAVLCLCCCGPRTRSMTGKVWQQTVTCFRWAFAPSRSANKLCRLKLIASEWGACQDKACVICGSKPQSKSTLYLCGHAYAAIELPTAKTPSIMMQTTKHNIRARETKQWTLQRATLSCLSHLNHMPSHPNALKCMPHADWHCKGARCCMCLLVCSPCMACTCPGWPPMGCACLGTGPLDLSIAVPAIP